MSDSVRISLEFTFVTTDSILFILKESSLSTQAIARPNAAILVPRTALDFVAENWGSSVLTLTVVLPEANRGGNVVM